MSSMFTNNKQEIFFDNSLQIGVVYVNKKPQVLPINDRRNMKYKILYEMLLASLDNKDPEKKQLKQHFTAPLNDNLTTPRDHENFENYNSILKKSYVENDLLAYYQYLNGTNSVVEKVNYERPNGEGIKDLNIYVTSEDDEDEEYEISENENENDKKKLKYDNKILEGLKNSVANFYQNDEYVLKVIDVVNSGDKNKIKEEIKNLTGIFNGKQFEEKHKTPIGTQFTINYIKTANDNKKIVLGIDIPAVGYFNSKEIDSISKNIIKCHKDILGERRYYWLDRVKGVIISSEEDVFDGKTHKDVDVYFKDRCKGEVKFDEDNFMYNGDPDGHKGFPILEFKQIHPETKLVNTYSFPIGSFGNDPDGSKKYKIFKDVVLKSIKNDKKIQDNKEKEKLKQHIDNIKDKLYQISKKIKTGKDIDKIEFGKDSDGNAIRTTKISDATSELKKSIDDLKSFLSKTSGVNDEIYSDLLDEITNKYQILKEIIAENYSFKDKEDGDKFDEKYYQQLNEFESLIKEESLTFLNEFYNIDNENGQNNIPGGFFEQSNKILGDTFNFVNRFKDNWEEIKNKAVEDRVDEDELEKFEKKYGFKEKDNEKINNLKGKDELQKVINWAENYKPEIFENINKDNISPFTFLTYLHIKKDTELKMLTDKFFKSKTIPNKDDIMRKKVVLKNNGNELIHNNIDNFDEKYDIKLGDDSCFQNDEVESEYVINDELVCDIQENKNNVSQEEEDFASIAKEVEMDEQEEENEKEEKQNKNVSESDNDFDEDNDDKNKKDNKSKVELRQEAEIVTNIANTKEKEQIELAINTLNELAEKDWFDKFINWLSSILDEDEFQKRYQNAVKFLMDTNFKTITDNNDIFKEALRAIKRAENNLWNCEPIRYNTGRFKDLENRNLIPYEVVEKQKKEIGNDVKVSLDSGKGRGRV